MSLKVPKTLCIILNKSSTLVLKYHRLNNLRYLFCTAEIVVMYLLSSAFVNLWCYAMTINRCKISRTRTENALWNLYRLIVLLYSSVQTCHLKTIFTSNWYKCFKIRGDGKFTISHEYYRAGCDDMFRQLITYLQSMYYKRNEVFWQHMSGTGLFTRHPSAK